MDFAGLIHEFGYLAVAVGTFLEGETVLVLAGAAAARGHLALPWVITIATVASFLGDQLAFWAGRRYGAGLVVRFPTLKPHAERTLALLDRHHVALILAVRFLYGLRIAGPIAIGMAGVAPLRVLLLNFIGAVVWAVAIAGAGYWFGQALASLLPGLDVDEPWLIGAAAATVALWWWLARRA